MPLIRVDVYNHYSDEKIRKVLDIIHRNVVKSFKVPQRDRYQIVTKHESNEMILEDTGLGFERTNNVIAIQVFSRKRDQEGKLAFYKGVKADLEKELNIDGKDLLISIFENGDADWSFGFGEAQFLNGEFS